MTDKKYEVRDWGSCNHEFELEESYGDEHGYIEAICERCGATATFVCETITPPEEDQERCIECEYELEGCVCEYCSECGTNMDYHMLPCNDDLVCEDCADEEE